MTVQTVPADQSFSQARNPEGCTRDLDMTDNSTFHANVLFFGIEQDLAADLQHALTGLCDGVKREALPGVSDSLAALKDGAVDLVFCDANINVIRKLRSAAPRTLLVAIGRFPEVSDWIDSLEAGADDYCGAPFEPHQLRWIFESHFQVSRMAA